jgi:hypothetical protein
MFGMQDDAARVAGDGVEKSDVTVAKIWGTDFCA